MTTLLESVGVWLSRSRWGDTIAEACFRDRLRIERLVIRRDISHEMAWRLRRFAVERPDGSVSFVESYHVLVDKQGRLVFSNASGDWYDECGRAVAMYQADQWSSVTYVIPDELEDEE